MLEMIVIVSVLIIGTLILIAFFEHHYGGTN